MNFEFWVSKLHIWLKICIFCVFSICIAILHIAKWPVLKNKALKLESKSLACIVKFTDDFFKLNCNHRNGSFSYFSQKCVFFDIWRNLSQILSYVMRNFPMIVAFSRQKFPQLGRPNKTFSVSLKGKSKNKQTNKQTKNSFFPVLFPLTSNFHFPPSLSNFSSFSSTFALF